MAKPDWRCGAARGLPIDRDRAWDGPAAAKRLLDAAGIGGKAPRPEVAKRGFLVYDAGNDRLRGSYKLPFCDLVSGRLTALRSGLDAAASRLPQTDAPKAELARARDVIDDYEKRMAKGKPKDKDAQSSRSALAHRLQQFAQRLVNTPALIDPDRAEACVQRLFGADADAMLDAAVIGADRDRPTVGYVVEQGIARIPIQGVLVQKLGMPWSAMGMTGYDGIRHNIACALADRDVAAIALEIDSPGGEVPGCFDLADDIYRARGVKPIHAVLDETACSAAYALASAASRISIPRTGVAGSVGVVWMHADISKALTQAGVTVTLLQFGARKTDGSPLQPLSAEARTRIQADIDEVGDLFVKTVARNRSMGRDDVRKQQAGCFMGDAARDNGLADDVLSAPEALARLAASL